MVQPDLSQSACLMTHYVKNTGAPIRIEKHLFADIVVIIINYFLQSITSFLHSRQAWQSLSTTLLHLCAMNSVI